MVQKLEYWRNNYTMKFKSDKQRKAVMANMQNGNTTKASSRVPSPTSTSKWHLSRSTIWTNKKEAERIAQEVRQKPYNKNKTVKVLKRKDGYWVKLTNTKPKVTIWKAHPIRSWSANPKEARVERFSNGNVQIYRRTFPENNHVDVWKENRKTKKISPMKSYTNSFEDARKSYQQVKKYMGDNSTIVDV